jgi:predicted DNA binding CopG/RHH family protein
MKKLKPIPKFKNEDEAGKFWAAHDTTEYVDWSKAVHVKFPNLKPTTESVSVRFPKTMLSDIKILANKRDVPYQSLIKILLDEKLSEVLKNEITVSKKKPAVRRSTAKQLPKA